MKEETNMIERNIQSGVKFTTNFFVCRKDGTFSYQEVKSDLPELLGKHEIGQGVGTIEITVFDMPPRLHIKSSLPLHGESGINLLLPKRNGHDDIKVLHISPQGRTIVEFRWSDIEHELKSTNK